MKPADKAPGGGRGGNGGGPGGAQCPLCGKPAVMDYRPFCSRRCSDVDLGRWLGGRYAIPGPPASGQEDGPDGD